MPEAGVRSNSCGGAKLLDSITAAWLAPLMGGRAVKAHPSPPGTAKPIASSAVGRGPRRPAATITGSEAAIARLADPQSQPTPYRGRVGPVQPTPQELLHPAAHCLNTSSMMPLQAGNQKSAYTSTPCIRHPMLRTLRGNSFGRLCWQPCPLGPR